MRKRSLETELIHAGQPQERVLGSVTLPIFQTSTYESGPAGADYHDIRYLRLNNSPNHIALHTKLAAIEGGAAAVVAASGMAAISTTLLAVLQPGDHVLAQEGVYGGTHALLTQDLARLGIETTFFDASDPAQLASKVRPATRVVYCEAVSNPLVRVARLEEIAAFANEHDLTSLVDSTFATPMNLRALELGFSGVLHSATKYLNGHSDLVAGALIGSAPLVQATLHKLNHLGATLDPHACFLLDRGLKTLAVRMRQHNEAGLQLAEFLRGHRAVTQVHYPGLAEHPDHAHARALLSGFGGMLSFELAGGAPAASQFLQRIALVTNAPSLGGPETLITLPAQTSHVGMSPKERRAIGVTDGLVRVSVGLEAVSDLVADFDQALAAARAG